MHRFGYMPGLMAFLAMNPLSTLAVPHPGKLGVRQNPAAVDCADISMFTVDYLKGKQTQTPAVNTCLFYTRRTNGETKSLSQTASNYACSKGLISIWQMWPSSGDMNYYNDAQEDSNWLRCIMKDSAQRQTYFENMSIAYTLACSGHTLVMTDDPTKVPEEGIWFNQEFKTMKDMGGTIKDVTAIDITGGNNKEYWKYGDPARQVGEKRTFSPRGLAERDNLCDSTLPEPLGEDWFG